MNDNEIILRVPGTKEYAVVLRTALGGVAILKNFDIGTLDDLRSAVDEACDCLLNQGLAVETLVMQVTDCGDGVQVTLTAEHEGVKNAPVDALEADIARSVLETLIPRVDLRKTDCGCIDHIGLTLFRTAV